MEKWAGSTTSGAPKGGGKKAQSSRSKKKNKFMGRHVDGNHGKVRMGEGGGKEGGGPTSDVLKKKLATGL